jgi:hypothetical protein
MSRSTPWGPAQQVIKHLTGFSTVSTASHGGLMISKGAAEKYLSEAARKRALIHSGYYCYEEDDDYTIPLFDLKDLKPELSENMPIYSKMSNDEIEKNMIELLSGSHPDYLTEKGIEPNEVPYKKWLLRKEASEARRNEDPKLVICCYNSSYTLIVNVLKVKTADDKEHFVTKESYQNALADEFNAIFTSLDCLDIINQDTIPPIESRLAKYALEISKPCLEEIKNNTPAEILAKKGKHNEPRTRFNRSLFSAKNEVTRFIKNNRGLSWPEAELKSWKEINKIKEIVDQEFHSCEIFQRSMLKAAA